MCNCGCNTCETEKPTLMLNENLAPRTILSEGLKHHIDTNKPLTEHLYRAGSRAYFDLFAEARSLYSRGILEFTNEDDLALLTETNLGHYGMFEGKKVPLDFPIELNEQMDIYDDIANMEFGMDYDQLGSNEKEWVRDEIDNMEMNEVTRYSGFDRNAEDPDSEPFQPTGSVSEFREDLRALFGKFKGDLKNPEFIKGVAQIMVNWKSLLRSQLNESDSNYPDFDLNKNIRYQDTVISNGMWRYTGQEQGGKGVYRNLNNGQILGFDRNDFAIFKNNLSSHFDISESIVNEVSDENFVKGIELLRSTLSKEGGAAGLEPLVKALSGLGFSKDEVVDLIKNNINIKQHRDGDYILLPLEEAKKKAKKNNKKLNKPMRDSSGGKAYKVYVKDPKTKKIKTVRFGSGGLRAKINDKKARNAFAKRHKCSTKKDKTKAGYWSCRLPRYAKLLGLKSNFGGFW